MKTKNHFSLSKIFVLAVCAFFFSHSGFSHHPNHYTIKADIDPESGIINGRVHLIYTNSSDEPVRFVSLRTKNPVDYFHHDIIIHLVEDENRNQMDIRSNEIDSLIYQVILPNCLAPGDKIELIIHFTASNIQAPYNYSLVQGIWHPKAVVFREGKYCAVEEQPDHYEVYLTIPEEFTLLSSGSVTDEVVKDNLKHIHLSAKNITSFGLIFSDELVSSEIITNEVNITGAYSKDLKHIFPGLMRIAADVVEFYVETFGFYPQPELIILPGGISSTGGFPLASNMVVIHQPGLDYEPFAKWIVAHETGHQFWGFDYLIDARKYANWLGLGLGIYADRLYNQARNPEGMYTINGFFGRYMEGVRRGYNTTLMQDYKKLSDIGFDWNNIISHGKGYTVIYLLEQVIGEEIFFDLTQHLLDNYRHRYLSVKDFQKEAEKISRQDLQWFFDDWVFANKVLDYRIDTVLILDDQFKIVINKIGEARLPLNADILLENGDRIVRPIGTEPEKQEIVFQSQHKPVHVQLDKRFARLLPDEKSRHWWGAYSGLEILEIQMPELAWNINRFRISITNNSREARKALINVQTNTTDVRTGGYGRTITHIVEPGDTLCLEREIALRPVPGSHRILLDIKDESLSYPVHNQIFEEFFPYKNNRINPLKTEEYRFAVNNDYPAFKYEIKENTVLYYLPDDEYVKEKVSSIIRKRREAVQYLSTAIYPEFADTIVIFLFPDHASKTTFTAHQGMGWALPNKTIYEVHNENEKVDPYHELVHVISAKIGNPPAMFNEGHAVYHHENRLWNGFHFDAWAKTYYLDGDLIPLRTLLMFREIGSPASYPAIAYPQSASVVKYLIDRFGYEKFLKAYELINMEDITAGAEVIDQKLEAVYGMNIEIIENEWLNYIKALEILPFTIEP